MSSGKINHVSDEELSNAEEGRRVAAFDLDQMKPTGSATDQYHDTPSCLSPAVLVLSQKLLAEAIGTYFIVFTGCAAIVVEKTKGEVTYPGICVTWGLIIMIVIYSLGHISGAHFNPSVTITFALLRGFPLKETPLYIIAQLIGSLLASGTLDLLFEVSSEAAYFGTVPSGSNTQSLVMEFIISFILMFVIFGTAFDERAHKEFAGVAIGMTILMNALIAGSTSGASMNPARSIGPAIVKHVYKGLWIYVVGPTLGCIAGGVVYNCTTHMEQLPSYVREYKSFLKGSPIPQ